MPKCSFCGKEYSIHRGVTLITNSGNLVYFCSSKCRKNAKMKRKKKKWTVVKED